MRGIHEEVFRELAVLASACMTGAIMTAVYDLFRIFRRIVRHGICWVSVEDCIYWIVFAVVEFVLLYQESNGVVRAYIFGGTMIGAALYHFLISRPLMRYISKGILSLKKRLKKLVPAFKMKVSSKKDRD